MRGAPHPGTAHDVAVRLDELRRESMLAGPLAQVVVTVDGLVAMVNDRAQVLFGASSCLVGRPFRDIDLSCRPAVLGHVVEQVQLDRRPMRVPDVRAVGGGGPGVSLDVEVTPLVTADSRLLGVSVVFDDVSRSRRLQEELDQANRQLESAYDELRSIIEQLETSDEELQLVSGRLQVCAGELDTAREFLDAVLAGLRAAVVVLDPGLTVQVWNRQAKELWGLRREETVGAHFLTLGIGLPLDELRPLIRGTLAGRLGPQEMAVSAVDRRGRPIRVRIVGTPLQPQSATGGPAGVLLLMDHDRTSRS